MKILDKRGFTLVELLVTFSLISIILPTLYGVLISGIQTYQKIQTEQQLRDDADYTSARILNELYAFNFDDVITYNDENGKINYIELVKSQKTSYTEQQFKDNDKIISVGKEDLKDDEKIKLKIELKAMKKNGKDVSVFFINDSPIDVTSDFKDSTIEIDNQDSFGMIYFNFVVNDLTEDFQIKLSSNFSYSKGSDVSAN